MFNSVSSLKNLSYFALCVGGLLCGGVAVVSQIILHLVLGFESSGFGKKIQIELHVSK